MNVSNVSDKLLYSYISSNLYYEIMELHNKSVQSICHVLHLPAVTLRLHFLYSNSVQNLHHI